MAKVIMIYATVLCYIELLMMYSLIPITFYITIYKIEVQQLKVKLHTQQE